MYNLSTGKAVWPKYVGGAAVGTFGRRPVTETGRALILKGPQLEWLDAAGEHPIRNVNGAYEAVTDRTGANVVYVESKIGRIHWIAGTDRGEGFDEDLGLTGTAPALDPDGSFLAFLTAEGSLQVYRRATRALRRISPESFSSFAVGGGAIFGVATGGDLLRIDAVTGAAITMVPAMAEISSFYSTTTDVTPSCGPVCYTPSRFAWQLTGGMILLFNGAHFTRPGWRVQLGSTDVLVNVLSDTSAYIQVPSGLSTTTFDYYSSEYPMRWSAAVRMYGGFVAACFGTPHENYDRLVTTIDPAIPGEIVHTFLTGLRGTQPVADGVPNPLAPLIPVVNPPTIDASAASTLFFGLAPGLIGIQQLDLQIIQPFKYGSVFGGAGCTLPVAGGG